jgi:hypothetical protein
VRKDDGGRHCQLLRLQETRWASCDSLVFLENIVSGAECSVLLAMARMVGSLCYMGQPC